MPRFAETLLIVSLATNMPLSRAAAQEPRALALPDERYKADILLVVAHPDDDGDHQASGVLATEAFDLAGDPSTFPEQVAGPTKRLEPFLENLRPWQPKKIYYFPDADRENIFRGKGPDYSVKEISKSSKQAYWRMALDSFRAHQTQAKSFLDKLAQMDEAQIEKMATSDGGWTDALHFVLGKSLVGGSVTGDVFDGITPGSLPFARPEVSPEPVRPELSVELGGP